MTSKQKSQAKAFLEAQAPGWGGAQGDARAVASVAGETRRRGTRLVARSERLGPWPVQSRLNAERGSSDETRDVRTIRSTQVKGVEPGTKGAEARLARLKELLAGVQSAPSAEARRGTPRTACGKLRAVTKKQEVP